MTISQVKAARRKMNLDKRWSRTVSKLKADKEEKKQLAKGGKK